MRKIVTFVMLFSLFSFGWMVANSYATEPMTKGSGKPYEASKLVGSYVKNLQGEYLGRVNDFIINKDRIAFGILSQGGFLGMGGKLVAIPFGALSYDHTGRYFVLDISRDRLESAPEFDRTRFASPTWAEDVYRFFGLQPYWTEGGYGEEASLTIEEESMEKEIMEDFPSKEEGSLGEYQYYTWP
jgi:hypothetical protein